MNGYYGNNGRIKKNKIHSLHEPHVYFIAKGKVTNHMNTAEKHRFNLLMAANTWNLKQSRLTFLVLLPVAKTVSSLNPLKKGVQIA